MRSLLTHPTSIRLTTYAMASSLLATSLLASCGSPPRPPTVDPGVRHPVNAAAAVELQVCKNDLHNTRMLAVESGRLAASTSATLDNLLARARTIAILQESQGFRLPEAASGNDTSAAGVIDAANSIYTVRFEFGSTRVDIPAQAAAVLIAQAKMAPLVLLRGRTDGVDDSITEGRIARARAVAVRDFLVAGGVDPARIRATHQPVGDQVADNGTPSGRSLNRRVEVELYRALPVAFAVPSPVASNAATATP